MKEENGNGIKKWFGNNLIAIVAYIIAVVVGWTMLNMRVAAIEAKVAQYPSKDWFELKFETIDQKLKDIDVKVQKHMDNETP
jgi:predicted negative regulator of RcsB-dependent stress response